MEVADELVVMNQGQVEQVGTPADLYDHPATPFVMSFIGPVNVLPPNVGILPTRGKSFEGDRSGEAVQVHDSTARVFLRPHDIEIHAHELADDAIQAQVDRIIHLGWEIQVELLLLTGQVLTAYLSREEFDRLQLKRHQQVYIKAKHIRVFSEYALQYSI